MVSLQLPILFDVSAGAVAFGEDASGVDIFDAHLKFELAGNATELASIRNAFRNILYADASENDISGVLFYTDISGLANTGAVASNISKAIQSGILNGNLKQYNGTGATYTDVSAGTGSDNFTARYAAPGIPLPVYSVKYTDTSNSTLESGGTMTQTGLDTVLNMASGQKYYTAPICDRNGTHFGRVLIRLMATHLMGHPFAQAFIANESSIIADISNCDIASQITTNLFTATSSLYNYGHDASDASITGVSAGYPIEKTSGIKNTILQRIYEQLLGSAPERFSQLTTQDGSGAYTSISGDDFYFGDVSGISGGNLDPSYCLPRRIPIQTSDTMSFYFRPRVKIELDSSGTVLPLTSGGSATDVSNVNIVSAYAGATSQSSIRKIFFQPRHRWISHVQNTNIEDLSGNRNHTIGEGVDATFVGTGGQANGPLMTGTNLTNKTGSGFVYFDAHIWRVKVTF